MTQIAFSRSQGCSMPTTAAVATGRAPGDGAGARMSLSIRTWVRPVGGAVILGVLLWRLGAAPVLDALGLVSGWSLLAAVGIAVLTTACCAWRWGLVAGGMGAGVPFGEGVAAYYRSQFLNSTLPGGVVGDIHRGVRHGQASGDRARGLRAVVWERSAGQLVQVVLALALLATLPSPVQSVMPAVILALVPVAAVVASAVIVRARRHGLLARRTWPGIVVASTVVVTGHCATFVIAARTAGVTAPLWRLLPLAVLALLAMGVPASVAGWGPREGVAAWAFGAAGLGAEQGLATAVVYGVLALVATLPGAVVLVVGTRWRRHGSRGVVRA